MQDHVEKNLEKKTKPPTSETKQR